MKKIILAILLFAYSSIAYSYGPTSPNELASCPQGTPTAVCSTSNNNCGPYARDHATRFYRPGLLHAKNGYLCGKALTCKTGWTLSQGECTPPPCPNGAVRLANGTCPDVSSSSSASSSSVPSCPQNSPLRDGNNICNTKCSSPLVWDYSSNSCAQPKNCAYPQLYNSNFNTCSDNPDNCAVGAQKDLLNGGCLAFNATSCPSGYQLTSDQLKCSPSANTASSSPTQTSSAAASSAANTSAPSSAAASSRPAIPIDTNDNVSPTQTTTLSQAIPADISNSQCKLSFSAEACKAIENCQLTFGVGKCLGVTGGQICPDSYVINGQKICVLTGSNSGASTSAGSGGSYSSSAMQCDPTKKDYDECMGRNETPTATQTQQIVDDLTTSGDAALDDYLEAVNTDIDDAKSNGVSFKEAPSQIKQALIAMIPQPRTCQNIPFTFYGKTVNLNCVWFEKFKTIFGWFLYIITAIYIFKLAMRPVPS